MQQNIYIFCGDSECKFSFNEQIHTNIEMECMCVRVFLCICDGSCVVVNTQG